jgi:hypothetical protein
MLDRALWYVGSVKGTTVLRPSLPPYNVTMTRIGVFVGSGDEVAALASDSSESELERVAKRPAPVH